MSHEHCDCVEGLEDYIANELPREREHHELHHAELERLREERNEALFVRGELALENERLRSELATCRELREYDAKDKARLRAALEEEA